MQLIEFPVLAGHPLYVARSINVLLNGEYTLAMFFITLDRLFTAVCGEVYTVFWGVKKAKVFLFIMWIPLFITVFAVLFISLDATENFRGASLQLFINWLSFC